MGIALLLEPVAQVRTMAIDRVSYHPADRQTRRLGTSDHALGQFGFGGKAECVRDMRRLSAWEVSAPLLGHIQFAIDEAMAPLGHVGEEDADLTVVDAPAHPAVLRRDARRVVTAFGKATFVQDEHRIE